MTEQVGTSTVPLTSNCGHAMAEDTYNTDFFSWNNFLLPLWSPPSTQLPALYELRASLDSIAVDSS